MYGGGGGGEEVGGMNLPAIIIYAYTVVQKINFCTQHTKSAGFSHTHTHIAHTNTTTETA